MKLMDFVENPDNPSTASEAAFAKIVRLVRENPAGLFADRIAYVTDHPAGKYVVLSGNKRLRALKQIHGDGFDAPAGWFQDVTRLTKAQRAEFAVCANVNEGRFDADRLLALYDRDELAEWVSEDRLGDLIREAERPDAPAQEDAPRPVELSFDLTSEDFRLATERLRELSDDPARAFMEVVDGRA